MVVKFVRSLSVWSFPVQSTEKASFVPKRQDPKALGNWGQRGNGRQDARKRREERFRIWHIGTIWQSFSLWLCTNFLQVHIFWTGSLRDVPCAVLKPCTLPEEAGQKGCRRGWVTVLQGTPGPKKICPWERFFWPLESVLFSACCICQDPWERFFKICQRGSHHAGKSPLFFVRELACKAFWAS